MATIYFAGGEDGEFQKIGNVSVDTATTAARRTANARCSLAVGVGAGTDGWYSPLPSTLTSFWFTARLYSSSVSNVLTTNDYIAFYNGTVRRLMLSTNSNGVTRVSIVKSDNAGTRTVLASSSLTISINTQYKFDVQVISYGASATVNVYLDGVLWVTYTGDVTTNSSTSLSGIAVGQFAANGTNFWSEVICTDADTRSLSLVTLPPAANGNAFVWSGSYADVDEVTINDADLITSGTANQLAQTTVTSSGITGTPAILGVVVSARAARGGSGPQSIQASVRTASTDYVSSTISLTTSWKANQAAWATNPNTAAAWSYSDLTAAGFNIGVKSIT